jgi:hypothetical protein
MIHRAFVLMPFAAEFDDVFLHIIRTPLTEISFETLRAADASSSRNIMHDVIQGIFDADLVIADLTGANPNVYYELGIAHAFGKKVVLLTQDIDEVPFDLRAYRVVTYSTHFARVEEAKDLVRAAAVGVRDGTSHFGSPVSDYLATAASRPPTALVATSQPSSSVESEEAGLLDVVADLGEGMSTITTIIEEVGIRLGKLNPKIVFTSEQMLGPLRYNPSKLREVVRILAVELDGYSTWLKGANGQYRTGIGKLTDGLDLLFSTEIATAPEARDGLESMVAALAGVEGAARVGRESMNGLSNVLDKMPKIEKEFNRAKKRLSEETLSLMGNIDQTISVMERTRLAAAQALGEKPV